MKERLTKELYISLMNENRGYEETLTQQGENQIGIINTMDDELGVLENELRIAKGRVRLQKKALRKEKRALCKIKNALRRVHKNLVEINDVYINPKDPVYINTSKYTLKKTKNKRR